MLTLLEHKRETSILNAREIPATADGCIRVNIANALAACAAAIATDVELNCIRDSLRVFGNGFDQTPGRFNLVTIEGRQVLMDYGHNVHALAAIGDIVKRSDAHQAVGVVTVPGDRRDDDVRAFGELAAEIFDRIVIREDGDRRGRAPGDIAAMLCRATTGAGMEANRVSVVLDEVESVHAAIDLAQPGDLVVALVDDVPGVWSSLATRMERATVLEDRPGVPTADPIFVPSEPMVSVQAAS
jgi:cyanophycin synthetase